MLCILFLLVCDHAAIDPDYTVRSGQTPSRAAARNRDFVATDEIKSDGTAVITAFQNKYLTRRGGRSAVDFCPQDAPAMFEQLTGALLMLPVFRTTLMGG
ncbi:hypothetical protein C2L64_46340 [Paraburkholderia hospita]|uniref:Uncharacterized protein n=1 Tax=Paraburkholderia hospita TaxID=169430 RepID=A0AAN1JL40_9BURK|nr:hypothetical protein [Paraburkholderia hospita]AUT75750.1 hypothetical protein C2L64_46340 [Paraburkholderia hospita]